MVPQPEQHARGNIDILLTLAGWQVCDSGQMSIEVTPAAAIRLGVDITLVKYTR